MCLHIKNLITSNWKNNMKMPQDSINILDWQVNYQTSIYNIYLWTKNQSTFEFGWSYKQSSKISKFQSVQQTKNTSSAHHWDLQKPVRSLVLPILDFYNLLLIFLNYISTWKSHMLQRRVMKYFLTFRKGQTIQLFLFLSELITKL